jgi:glycosyltransferase involved in cell wall biosynthesis
MKIVFINDLVYGYATGAAFAIGGAERQQWLLARGLAAAGWKVTVGVRQALIGDQRVCIDGVEFAGIGDKGLLRPWYRFLVSERPQWWYWRCASHLLGLAVIVAKLARVRMIFATAFDTDVNIRRALYQRARWWPLYALGLAWSDRIFVQNDAQLSGLPSRWRAKTYKIPSISPELTVVTPHEVRHPYVAWVAMLRSFKRPDLLVEIARRASDIHFVVCGGATTFTAAPGYGEKMAARLRALPNVDYRGQVSPEEALHVIANAAVFLSTSDGEGFPNTFLQAWSAGTPVLSVTSDPDDIIRRHALGKIGPALDQVIGDLRSLIGSPQERENIGRRASGYVAKHHSAAAVIRTFEAVTGGTVSKQIMQPQSANFV